MRLKIADAVTALSLASSMLALLFAMQGKMPLAAAALVAATILDFMDGKVARMMNQASEFGMYLDSLTDIIAFGAIPVFIALSIIGPDAPLVIAAVIFLGAGIYRLARFQATRLQGEFQGMPITMNGIFIAALLFVPRKEVAFPAFFLLSAVLMASTFKVKKL